MLASPECEISFSSAQLDVCSGKTTASSRIASRLQSLDAVNESTLRIVKFGGPIAREQRAAVEGAGAEILGYAPYYAYIVQMDASKDRLMRAIPGVVWSGPFLPAFKVDVNILNELNGAKLVSELEIDSLQVTLATTHRQAAARSTMSAISGLSDVVTTQIGGETRVRARFNRDQLGSVIEELALNPDVIAVGFHWPDRLYNSQGHWLHQSNINSPSPRMPVWDKGIYGCGQIVGALDTGLFLDNVAFRDPTQTTPISVCTAGAACSSITPNLNARKVISYYKWSGAAESSWADGLGHGTHVVGSIIGNDNVSNPGTDCVGFTTPGGNTDLDGMAPGAKLVMQEGGVFMSYLSSPGGGPYHAAQIAYQNGARIHSNSWGSACVNAQGFCISGCTVTYNERTRDADRLAKDRPEMLLVFAAGNHGSQCAAGSNVASPANAKNVLAMGATLRGAAANDMASFSSRGPTFDSRTKPDLTAQGDSVVSAARSANGTRPESGTSMATPTAAGMAALVRDYLAQGFYPSGARNPADAITNPSGLLIKAIMMTGAVAMTGTGAGSNPGQAQGFGRIHLDNSLFFQTDQAKLYLHDSPTGIGTGDIETHQLTLIGGQPFSVVLTWLDDAAAIGADPAIVNSLRLEVEAPSGAVWTQKLPVGYRVDNASTFQDTSTSNYDDRNTVQRISFAAPETGTYRIRVVGINVPASAQRYALAASGNFVVSTEPDYALTIDPTGTEICAGASASVDVGVVPLNGFTTPVALSTTGLPPSVTSSFSSTPVTPVPPHSSSVLTISATANVAAGDYTYIVHGASTGSPSLSRNTAARLKVDTSAPAPGNLISPVNAEAGFSPSGIFSWSSFASATSYRFELSTDPSFASHLIDETVEGLSYTPNVALNPLTTYFWRVSGINACNAGAATPIWRFTTGIEFCKAFNAAIPDNSPAGVSDTIALSDSSVLSGLKVAIKATHSWVGDLQIKLSKGATTVLMVDRPGIPASADGCGNDNVDIVLDDNALQPVESQCNSSLPALSGPVQPNTSINAAFAGSSLAGTWTLNVSDHVRQDAGMMQSWCLIATPEIASQDVIFADSFEVAQ